MWIEEFYVIPQHVVMLKPLPGGGTRIILTNGWLDTLLSIEEVARLMGGSNE